MKNSIKLTVKAARRKLGVPMPAAMPCKIPTKSSALNRAGHRPHQDHITAKGMNSMTHCSPCSQIHSDASLKIPDAKAAVRERMGKTGEKIRHGS